MRLIVRRIALYVITAIVAITINFSHASTTLGIAQPPSAAHRDGEVPW